MTVLLESGPSVGMHAIIGSPYQFTGAKADALNKLLKDRMQYVLLGMRLNDQTFLDKVYNSREPRPELDVAYLHDRKQSQALKLTRY